MRPPVAVCLRWSVSGVQGAPRGQIVAACRGSSCRYGPAADRTPALQYGWTSLHGASGWGNLAVLKTLLQHRADVAARDRVGAAGVPVASPWRCARVCQHAMFVRAIVCMVMCARNRARLWCCAEAGASGEVELVSGTPAGRAPCVHDFPVSI